ncbi:MAG TPA: serine hydrolase domain-containing protein [Verrucomicrobiae bacterium]
MNTLRAFAFALFALAAAVNAATKPDFSELEAFVQSELRRNDVPGCAVAVVVDGEVAFAKGFGVANVDTGEPVKSDMLFRIGSTTKMFTAATLVSLAEDGKVKLEAPASDYVKGLAPKIGRVTSHQLLSHNAGLADETFMEGPHDETALGDWVRGLKDSLVFTEPGKIYSYSNPGFWVAGFVAESAGGKRYADLVAERVLKPCGMTRSTFRPTEAMTWPLAVGHGPEGRGKPSVVRPLADNAGGWPAGQLFTTAPEFARFCIAFMNGGKLDGKQALSPFVVEKLSTPHVAVPGREGHYGYGLSISDEGGLRWLSHGGSRTGYGSTMKMCPQKKFAAVILGNKTGAGLAPVADKAAQLVLGTPPRPREPRVTLTMNDDELKRLAGVYSNGRTTIRLVARDGKLMGPRGELKKVGENLLRLVSGENGDVTNFVIVPGTDGRIEYLFRQGRALRRLPDGRSAGNANADETTTTARTAWAPTIDYGPREARVVSAGPLAKLPEVSIWVELAHPQPAPPL